MRRIFGFLSLSVLALGAYLRFLYDVPDGQDATNLSVSGFLMIVGASTLLINLLWTSGRTAGKDKE